MIVDHDDVELEIGFLAQRTLHGILGLIYASVSETGMEIFTVYGHLVLVLVVVILIAALVTNPILVVAVTRSNPYPLVLRCLKDSAVMAFFTRSSAAPFWRRSWRNPALLINTFSS